MSPGSLTIVGTGLSPGHLTESARYAIKEADKVLHLVGETMARFLESINPKSDSLRPYYGESKRRLTSYLEMIDRILEEVRAGQDVCAAFQGHPGVCVFPSHEAIRRAREEGIEARMLPGVSTEDCLFADLGLDPAWFGCQSYEATDFVLRKRAVDTSVSLILWQVGAVGVRTSPDPDDQPRNLDVLAECLAELYGQEHLVVVYECSVSDEFSSWAETVVVRDLPKSVTHSSTLLVPPKHPRRDTDPEMLRRLAIDAPPDIELELTPSATITRVTLRLIDS